jgi:3-(3-hydroxy-phenyl)propionate hydroxylase
MITHDVEVLVAGLGPVGSVAALYLAQKGIQVAAVEANKLSATDLRASTFHAPTIEILDRLGATDTLFNYGLRAPVYQFRDRKSGETFSFDLGEIADVTRFPYRIQCEQHLVADEVVKKLASLPGATVRFQSRLLFLEQDAAGVTAYVDTGTAVEKYRARYLIAADGANSVARKVLDLGFPGFTYDQKFLCLSTAYPIEDAFENLSCVNYLSDPDEWMVLLKVPTLWRVLVPAPEHRSDEELLSDANKNTVFRNMLGSDVDVETKHRTIYRVHQRVCERFRVGRVCLIGDSVHLNSPMGGFGMNSGIHDAINLGEKLVAVLRQGGSDDLLSLYERQRRTVTENFVQAQTIENTKLMSEGWGAARAERRAAMSHLMNDAAARRAFLLKQSMFTSLEEAATVV